MPTPVDDEGPVSAGRYPIWIGLFCAMAGLAIPATATAAPAVFNACRRVSAISFPPKDKELQAASADLDGRL